MVIKTKFMGEINIQENDIVEFIYGLPGFENLNKFVLINMAENTAVYYMQSLDDEQTCFVVMSPFDIVEDYEIDISESTVKALGLENANDVKLCVILNIPEDVKKATANLQAPIVINIQNSKAMQEILETSKYTLKHRLVKEA